MHYALLQRDDKGFAHPERIQKLVKNYSQFVSFPIYTWQEKGFTKEVSYLFSSLWWFE
jgi:heat shock protein beta